MPHPRESILQFGAGKFLRAFADLFVHETNQAAAADRGIVVVQSTGSLRAEQFTAAGCRFHVAVRGLDRGQPVDRCIEVSSVARALAAQRQWADVLAMAASPALQLVISNVTEAGYALDAADLPDDAPPRSYPAKLLTLLLHRRRIGLPGVTILPCELLDANARRLCELVVEQARRWSVDDGAIEWITAQSAWRNTLVDRIVSSPSSDDPLGQSDPLYCVAELFALWAIEGRTALPGLSGHPAVALVDDVAAYGLRKVRILNGAHTALVAKAMPLGFSIVRQAVGDPQIQAWLRRLLFEEIVPVLEGRTDDPAGFARDTLERFANPFLEHRLADIALHHATKLQTRLAPTLADYEATFGRKPPLLAELLG